MNDKSGRALTWNLLLVLFIVGLIAVVWNMYLPENVKSSVEGALAKIWAPVEAPEPVGPIISQRPATPAVPDAGIPAPPGVPGVEQPETPGAQPAAPPSPFNILAPQPRRSARTNDDGEPQAALKACVDMLEQGDLVGAEVYVNENGMKFTMGGTTGAHEILWKGLFSMRAYHGVDYDQVKVAGQTAWIPVYMQLGQTRVTPLYVVMANRGDGWKVDHLTDPRRF